MDQNELDRRIQMELWRKELALYDKQLEALQETLDRVTHRINLLSEQKLDLIRKLG
jgi:hypothetical protein